MTPFDNLVKIANSVPPVSVFTLMVLVIFTKPNGPFYYKTKTNPKPNKYQPTTKLGPTPLIIKIPPPRFYNSSLSQTSVNSTLSPSHLIPAKLLQHSNLHQLCHLSHSLSPPPHTKPQESLITHKLLQVIPHAKRENWRQNCF